ncbi:hypothetical protein [Bacillus sp. FJAT-47783]|uniref:hypothetical protein n=1 Tax=Bacillus sp. FJAT-47783 TaxID=2922712 RepID=UPI001FAC1DEA|nr:hypothetical protein [Bacillus sp. FJAT-47783]
MPIFTLIKRDLRMRLYYGRNQIITQIVFFLIITIFFILAFELNDLSTRAEWISIERFWNGFSEVDLEIFKQSGTFQIPYLWLIFQLLYFLSLRTFFTIDLTGSSGFIIIRTGTRRFVISKVISLFLYTTLYILLFLLFIFFVSLMQFLLFHVSLSFISNWKISIIFCLFFILTLFLEALFFEAASLFLGEIIAFIAIFSFNFLSIFSKSAFLVSNYTMFSRWNEATVFRENWFFILIWVCILILFLFAIELFVVNKIDFINEKGEK